ncbi:MAG: DUF2271 domain-containing protein [Pseudolabrys sp.]|nr:DUF2271 domain-containing protein [Pseudolabrys sp.]
MKKYAVALGLAAAIAFPALAQAKTVTLNTTLKGYGGNGAYLAIYLTDAQGKFHSTLRVAGGKAKYHSHLRDWSRGERRNVDGITGASVGSGQSLKVSVNVADALIDAGYQIRIDSAVENGRENAAEVVVPLTAANAGKPVSGKGYVKSFSFDM